MKKINASFKFFISAILSLGVFTSIAWLAGNANKETGMGGLGKGLAIAFYFMLSLVIPFVLSFIGTISGIIAISEKYTIGKLLAMILNILLLSTFIVFLILIISSV